MSEATLENVKNTAAKIIEELKNQKGCMTSWDLKLKLHLSNSSIYIALGWLLNQNKIAVQPEDLTYKVKLTE
ncbi:MAG: winged helix-turn-helix domain-containing protein [Elusimicrobia bacterium]|nr:winged helix-turn-helix domain-containing protein [Elusimicrobiota bacterium]